MPGFRDFDDYRSQYPLISISRRSHDSGIRCSEIPRLSILRFRRFVIPIRRYFATSGVVDFDGLRFRGFAISRPRDSEIPIFRGPVFSAFRDFDVSAPWASMSRCADVPSSQHSEISTCRDFDVSRFRGFETPRLRWRGVLEFRGFDVSGSLNSDLGISRFKDTRFAIQSFRYFAISIRRGRDAPPLRNFEISRYRGSGASIFRDSEIQIHRPPGASVTRHSDIPRFRRFEILILRGSDIAWPLGPGASGFRRFEVLGVVRFWIPAWLFDIEI